MATGGEFLRGIVETGAPVVGLPGTLPPGAALRTDLAEVDRLMRAQCPGDPPEVILDAAEWASCLFHDACAFLLYREVPAGEVTSRLQGPCPTAPSCATDWSVDLVFRYLPDLHEMACRVADRDPLIRGLEELARRFPLSSVGIKGVQVPNHPPFARHPALRILYADRIIQRGDWTRLHDPETRSAVKEVVGAAQGLCPRVSKALEDFDHVCG